MIVTLIIIQNQNKSKNYSYKQSGSLTVFIITHLTRSLNAVTPSFRYHLLSIFWKELRRPDTRGQSWITNAAIQSDPLCFSRQCLCIVVLLRPSCVHVSQPAETWPPLGQSVKTQILIRGWADRTESPGLWTSTFIVKDQQTVVRGSCGVAVGSMQVLQKYNK